MKAASHLKIVLLGATAIAPCFVASAQTAAQSAPAEATSPQSTSPTAAPDTPGTIVITGSRVIRDATQSPTPLTVVSTDQLALTTPNTIADGLNKLPVFIGSQTSRLVNNAGSGNSSNTLNLRNFGSNRALILLDGQRIAPSSADGSVNIDIIPQALVQSVEVVTGGASAVYGSDAVTGVVNFILDKRFTGVKFNFNSGISQYGDAIQNKAAVAFGTQLFGGRGHFEASFDFNRGDPLYQNERSVDGQDGAYTRAGLGTAASPFTTVVNGKLALYSFGGKITACGTGCTVNNTQFASNGVIGPFNAGTPTGTANISSGGDGVYNLYTNILPRQRIYQGFARFSYDLTDDIGFWVNARAGSARNTNNFQMTGLIQTGPDTFFKDNAYLSAAAQAQLRTGTGNTFRLGKYNDFGPDISSNITDITSESYSISTGLDGSVFDRFKWSLYFGHGVDDLKVANPINVNNQLLFASNDAVVGPAGTPVCRVSTGAFASLYPGCVPSNQFGPTSLSREAYDYYTSSTYFAQNITLDDLSANISGDLFNLPAGPLVGALSGEYRWDSYKVDSNRGPALVNCAGLPSFCDPNLALWQGNTQAPISRVRRHVWEIAGELGIPLLKDVPLFRELSANVAGRYTKYSTSGAVKTWKLGLDWHVSNDLRFRGTASQDIRAPSLRDLFSPQQSSPQGFSDLHTGATGMVATLSTGNPDLVPEKGRTYSAGVVLTPTFFRGFTFSVDYYRIKLVNAITSISGATPAVQTLCEDSGGTSPFCTLYIRPLPFSNRTPANYPTTILSQSLNAAVQRTEGWDFEANYRFDLANLSASLPGRLTLRSLVNVQPKFELQQFTNAPLTLQPVSRTHVTTFASYNASGWTLAVQDRWLGTFSRKTVSTQVFAAGQEKVKPKNYVDLTLTKDFSIGGVSASVYFNVQNLFDTDYPIFPTAVNIPGLYFRGVQGASTAAYDAIGRYFLVGVRGRF